MSIRKSCILIVMVLLISFCKSKENHTNQVQVIDTLCNSPENVITNFIVGIQSKDMELIRRCGVSQFDFSSLGSQTITSYEINKDQSDSFIKKTDTALISATMVFTNGDTIVLNYQLIKTNGKWQIMSYSSQTQDYEEDCMQSIENDLPEDLDSLEKYRKRNGL